MLVLPKKEMLLIRAQHAGAITTVIPQSKVIKYKGHPLVAVPHRVDEVKVLRNIGFQAPSPIHYYYGWPGRYKPFQAQKDTAAFLTVHRNAFVLNDLGTGKTMATLWAYDYLKQIGQVDKMLIVAPLSTLERTWVDEIFMSFPHLNVSVLHGSRERRLKLLQQPADIYVINHDGIKVSGLLDAFAQRDDINLVIIDEVAQAARNGATDRWKLLNKICNKQTSRRLWALTGKPTPNAPTDAWAQVKLVNPSNVPPYFGRFRDMVMRQVGPFTWLPRDDSPSVVHRALQPSIRFTRSECVGLPPCVHQTRTVELSAEQRKAYKEMMTKLRAEVESGEVRAVNEAVKVSKLLQIACGVVYTDQGEAVIPAQPRLDLLEEIIDEADTKVIIFVPFVSTVAAVAAFLSKRFSVETIHGGISKHDRDEIFRRFQLATDPQVLVAQPAAMAHGLNLTAASTIVWFSAITSNEIYEQANGRIVRPGQKYKQLIINIEGTPIERKLFDRLRHRQKLQGILLELVNMDLQTA